tara:strand:+ start:111 stop:578 length:468 start_codon:yes stop_codon:yes gene_type:complete
MSWEAIGAMGSLLGAISVLLTLLYLAKQIKENSKLLTTSVYQTAVDGYNEMASMFLENPELARNLLMDKPAQLSEVDAYKLNLILRVYLNQGLKLFKLYEAGIFPEEDWLLRAAEIKQVINQTDFSREFAKNNLIFSQMCRHLDQLEVEPASKFE